MPIRVRDDDTVTIKLGYGDVGMLPERNALEEVYVRLFAAVEPKPTGEKLFLSPEEYEHTIFPISFQFNSPEAIDNFIGVLNTAKGKFPQQKG